MKISVFGSGGFIGSHFCELYPEIAVPIPKNEYDVLGDNTLYLISTTHNYESWLVNINTNIMELWKHLCVHVHKDNVFNFVSSWFVYGDVELPATERTQPNPKGGNYNLTKLWAEQMVQDYCREKDISYRIFRLANVFGKGDKFSEKKNALQYLINEMKHDRDIYLYNGGMFFRDYIHVDTVCKALKQGMEKLPVNEIYNIGSGRPVLFGDMIRLAHEVLESKSKIMEMETPEFHDRIQVKDFWMSTEKICSHGICTQSYPFRDLVRMLNDEYL